MPELQLEQKTNYELVEEQSRLNEIAKALESAPIVSLDTEATSLDPHDAKLLLFQIATPGEAYLFDARHLDLRPFQSILGSEKILKLAQNAKFDYGMLKELAGVEIVNIFDTMLAERILTCGMTKLGDLSLAALSRKYLGIELAKEVRETFFGGHLRDFTKKQLDYAAKDVLVLFPIYEAQRDRLQKEQLEKIASLEFELVPVVSEMELRGFLIDVEKWRQVIADYRKKAQEIDRKMQEELRPYSRSTQKDLFGNHANVVNLNSPSQIMEAFRRVGLDLPSTGEEILARYDHPLAKLLLEYRESEKIISAFGENLLEKINPKTGRIHPDYMQIGADTGRFACSNPNLQQIPTDSMFRSCFIASPGHKLVVADYSQIELRIMAELSEDPVFMKAFKEDQDLHALTASQMFNIPIDQVSKEKRFQAKSINFGLMYGRGARSLAVQLGVSEDESRRLLDKYFRQYHRVKTWLDNISRDAIRRGYSTTLGGRKRYYEKVASDDPSYDRQVSYIERQGKNTPIQGTSADITKMALVNLRQRIRKEGLAAVPIHTVHDEIVVEAPVSEAEQTAKIVKEEMVRAGEALLKKVPVKVDVVVSDIWEH
ncbi:MAG: DNA-directed DNA polymerase, DNA polymerase I [candidate division WWE3 bacterium CSP1-7]|uniref:DNA polymerase I n=1 Tax=candidate division WWE3 bacterium CSP1-7 TaxID=1576480 RepID=A0A0T5ZXQ5_UNCKA|nr:MAG: DNA-directed DNA polymerase, DNA polymerase I [candidate division WWE3 bacterium CSP1-7]